MKLLLKCIVAACLLLTPVVAQADDWKPDHPVTIIVPFPPGGTADQVGRLVAAEMQKALHQSFIVINQAGATGGIGTRAVRDAPKDGYTWLCNANRLVGTYSIMSDVKVGLDDFIQFVAITNVPVISVATASQYSDFGELYKALKDHPGTITAGTAGPATSGHFAMEAIAQTAHIKYRLVNYQGGSPAVMSTVSQETVINAELASDQAEMIRAKRLRPLAALSDEPLNLVGYGTIPSIKKWIPDLPAVTTQFGILLPKGVPQNVVDTVTRIWNDQVAHSATLKQWADDRGALTTVLSGKAADDAVRPTVISSAWMMNAAGLTRASPETIGIPPLKN